MTDWAQLNHAYGSAEDIPGLLEQAEPDSRSHVWNDLWSRLCHQGTVYSASYAALPELTRIARRWPATDRVMPLFLAGAIVAGVDQPYGDADPQIAYAAEIAELAALTEESLHEPRTVVDPRALAGLAKRLYDRALVDGHPEVANRLTYVFGSAHCAECAELFRVDQAIIDRWGT
jgi:hypothetical protein